MNMNVNDQPKENLFVEVRNCQVGVHFSIFDRSIVLQSIFDLPIISCGSLENELTYVFGLFTI
jgi:hypothetical protein